MIYLNSPYSHPDVEVREQRFRAACQAVSRLLALGQSVFSPFVHGHPLVDHGLPTDWPFWERFDRDHLVRCDEVIVLMLDGWRESIGVAAEIQIAGELGKPVRDLATVAPDHPSSGAPPTLAPTLAAVAKEAGR